MNEFALLIAATLSAGTPLALAGLGLLINEKVGVVNLGAEGMMLMAAVVGFAVGFHTGNPWLAFAAGAVAGALGAASNYAGGLAQFYHSGSTVKRIHAAHAAGEGVHAALLAAAGFSGPADILEGKDGFARAYADGHDFGKGLAGIGETWRLLETAIKPHATSARVLAAIETIKAELKVRLEDLRANDLGRKLLVLAREEAAAPGPKLGSGAGTDASASAPSRARPVVSAKWSAVRISRRACCTTR